MANIQGAYREGKNAVPIQFGSEFDVSFDMNPPGHQPLAPVTEPSGWPAHRHSRTGSARESRPRRTGQDSDLSGTPHDENEASGFASARAHNQAPVSMGRYSTKDYSPRSSTSEVSTPRVKSYYFGWREEVGYIPKPFISSHRQKIAPDRPLTASTSSWRRKYDRPVKLSRRRRVEKDDRGYRHSIVIGSFDQFEKTYRGP
jgi:hypothetical protein